MFSWLRTRRALTNNVEHWRSIANDRAGEAKAAWECANRWQKMTAQAVNARQQVAADLVTARDEIGRMRDGILLFSEQITEDVALSFKLRQILDPPKADPERLDEAMHRRATYAQRAEANRARVAEAQASLDRCVDHAQAIKAHLDAVAVQRQVDARLSSVVLPCGCRVGDACYCSEAKA